jgi:hypothetical protein
MSHQCHYCEKEGTVFNVSLCPTHTVEYIPKIGQPDDDKTFNRRIDYWKVAKEVETLIDTIKGVGIIRIEAKECSVPFSVISDVHKNVVAILQHEVDRLRLLAGVSRT